MRLRSIRGSLDRSFGLSLSSPECLSLEPSIWALSSVSFNSFLTQWSHKGNFKRITGQKMDSMESDTALLKGNAWPFYSNYRPDWTVSELFIYTFWLLFHIFSPFFISLLVTCVEVGLISLEVTRGTSMCIYDSALPFCLGRCSESENYFWVHI